MSFRSGSKWRLLLCVVLLFLALALPAAAETRLIVRTSDSAAGLVRLKFVCFLLGCNVGDALDGALSTLYLVTASDLADPNRLMSILLSLPGIVAVELDQLVRVSGTEPGQVPPALLDTTPVDYYGTIVRRGYVTQPAVQIVKLSDARFAYNVAGAGVVAVIDTGVDPDHPALRGVLLEGYDFTRNRSNGSEASDVTQSTAAMVDQDRPYFVNQSTAALVDQSTAAMVDNPQYAAFGHGTIVAGIVHLIAPQAKILPLKAFKADGSGYSSDILRAIYFAAQNGANVLNMSFSYRAPSVELDRACDFAARKGLILVASAGNDGASTMVYPAGFDVVMGVASTTNSDTRSTFSNYGSVVWVAAPGEGVVSTYPFGTYAAAWGTSFSTPFVAGAAALLVEVTRPTESDASAAVANAQWISSELGNGRLDLFLAVQAWRQRASSR